MTPTQINETGPERLAPFEPSPYTPPRAPLPTHHDLDRPLVLCVWDGPNMDASLFSVTSQGGEVTRPQFDVFARWLTSVEVPDDDGGTDIEAVLFQSVSADRASVMAPFISAVRQAGIGVFCRDRAEGDIDDAIAAFVGQRFDERAKPGTLVLATADKPLGRHVADPLAAAGWRVVIIAYRELCSWPTGAGHELVDPEDIPGLFSHRLDRFNLEHLPLGGAFAPPTHGLTHTNTSVTSALRAVIVDLVDANGGEVLLSSLGSAARNRIPDFATLSSGWRTFAAIVTDAIAATDYQLVEEPNGRARVVAAPSP